MNFYEIFVAAQNRYILARFQFSAQSDFPERNGADIISKPHPSGQYFNPLVHMGFDIGIGSLQHILLEMQ